MKRYYDYGSQREVNEQAEPLFLCAMSYLYYAGHVIVAAAEARRRDSLFIVSFFICPVVAGGSAYWLLGYSLSSNSGNSAYVGYPHIFHSPSVNGRELFDNDTLDAYRFLLLFSICLGCTCIGTVDRWTVLSNGFLFFWSCFAMPLLLFTLPVHWCWSDVGFFARRGFRDFAGASLLHLMGSTHALTISILTCKTVQKLHESCSIANGEECSVNGRAWHTNQVALTVIGHAFMGVGAVASQLAIDFVLTSISIRSRHHLVSVMEDGDHFEKNSIISSDSYRTHLWITHPLTSPSNSVLFHCALAMAASALSTSLISRYLTGLWSVVRTCRGMLAAMVMISSSTTHLSPWICLILGLLSGPTYLISRRALSCFGPLFDPLDGVAINFAPALISLIFVPLFASEHRIGAVMFESTGLALNRVEDDYLLLHRSSVMIWSIAWNLLASLALLLFSVAFTLCMIVPFSLTDYLAVTLAQFKAGKNSLFLEANRDSREECGRSMPNDERSPTLPLILDKCREDEPVVTEPGDDVHAEIERQQRALPTRIKVDRSETEQPAPRMPAPEAAASSPVQTSPSVVKYINFLRREREKQCDKSAKKQLLSLP